MIKNDIFFSGNIYIFDLSSMNFWIWPNIIQYPTVIKFIPEQKSNIVIGTKAGELLCVNVGKFLINFFSIIGIRVEKLVFMW